MNFITTNIVTILRILIISYALIFGFFLIKDCLAHKEEFTAKKTIPLAIIGFITNLLDTWGIGSFATTQAGFKFTKSSRDEVMPGTLNIGDTIPVVVEFVLFLSFVSVAAVTLVGMIAGAAVGAIIGASIVSKWPLKLVRTALGCALAVLAVVLVSKLLAIGPFERTLDPSSIVSQLEENDFQISNGDVWLDNIQSSADGDDSIDTNVYFNPKIAQSELDRLIPLLKTKGLTSLDETTLSSSISDNLVYGLTGIKLVIGIVANFFLGALMTIGVGLYAPCMALCAALGMNVAAAFPIMMGSCAFLMPSAGMKFIKEGKYDRKAAIFLTIFGCLGVAVAYKITTLLPMDTLTWIIVAVMLYTSFTFFKDASRTPVENA